MEAKPIKMQITEAVQDYREKVMNLLDEAYWDTIDTHKEDFILELLTKIRALPVGGRA